MMTIGLTGKKRSGKSTASAHITRTYNAVPVNFKDALVDEIKERFAGTLQEIVTLIEKDTYDGNNALTVDALFHMKPPVIRRLLQNYGTEVRRNDNANYWVDIWRTKATASRIVVDDVRFLNEAQAIRDMGGIVIRIEREGLEQGDTHQSEMEMDSIEADYTIRVADGEYDKLYAKLDEIILERLKLDIHDEE